MKAIIQPGLADEAAARIREEILRGRLEVGARLQESDLAADLEISRAPVREALMRLEQQGLVVSERYRGARVVDLTDSDIEELVSLRCALEPLAWSRACQRRTENDLLELEQVIEQMRTTLLCEDQGGLVQLDIEFHERVFQMADHERLYAAWTAITYQVALYLLRRRTVTDDYHQIIVNEHSELLEMLRRRDLIATPAAITEHITRAHQRLSKAGRMADSSPNHRQRDRDD